jgi:hypothetical protein
MVVELDLLEQRTYISCIREVNCVQQNSETEQKCRVLHDECHDLNKVM